ncbi:MAG: hypothetical protein ACR2M3_10595 [Thermomicrobiales bacterium]
MALSAKLSAMIMDREERADAYFIRTRRHAACCLQDVQGWDFFATIPGFQGVWAHAKTVEECREELREVLEDWLFLSIADHDQLPIIKPAIAVCRGA